MTAAFHSTFNNHNGNTIQQNIQVNSSYLNLLKFTIKASHKPTGNEKHAISQRASTQISPILMATLNSYTNTHLFLPTDLQLHNTPLWSQTLYRQWQKLCPIHCTSSTTPQPPHHFSSINFDERNYSPCHSWPRCRTIQRSRWIPHRTIHTTWTIVLRYHTIPYRLRRRNAI